MGVQRGHGAFGALAHPTEMNGWKRLRPHRARMEAQAGDAVEQNLHPLGRMFYGASTMLCVPASLAFKGPALGAQAGEKRLREVISEGGFKKIRRATETPFNIVLEARP